MLHRERAEGMMGWGETGRAPPFSQLPFPAGIWESGNWIWPWICCLGERETLHTWNVGHSMECGIGASVGKGMRLFHGNAALPWECSSSMGMRLFQGKIPPGNEPGSIPELQAPRDGMGCGFQLGMQENPKAVPKFREQNKESKDPRILGLGWEGILSHSNIPACSNPALNIPGMGELQILWESVPGPHLPPRENSFDPILTDSLPTKTLPLPYPR